jgi:hypothetical protein
MYSHKLGRVLDLSRFGAFPSKFDQWREENRIEGVSKGVAMENSQ